VPLKLKKGNSLKRKHIFTIDLFISHSFFQTFKRIEFFKKRTAQNTICLNDLAKLQIFYNTQNTKQPKGC